ncbi:MAG: DUF2304 domain-containing protein [Candidatus Nanopelagicales bacterium]
MASTYLLGLFAAAGTVLFVFEMLRRGILREKFAALWLLVSLAVLIFAVFPSVLGSLSRWLGIALPANLLFLMSAVLLLLVSVQLSYEISRVEARTRRLAEDLALLRHELAVLKRHKSP